MRWEVFLPHQPVPDADQTRHHPDLDARDQPQVFASLLRAHQAGANFCAVLKRRWHHRIRLHL